MKPSPAIISIDRGSKSWAVFDASYAIVKEFVTYTDEAAALAEAKEWFALRSDDEPEIMYPRITSMRTSTSRRR